MSDVSRSADYDATHSGGSYLEYGVIVDRTSKGLGYFVVETFREPGRARAMADRSQDMFGFPAEVCVRRVTRTAWTRVVPPERTEE